MFNFIKKKVIENRENDALLFEYVLEEINKDIKINSLWAKAIAYSEGNDKKIKPLYMQYRVQSIKDEFTKRDIAYDELKRDILFYKITNIFKTETNIVEKTPLLSATTIVNVKKPTVSKEEPIKEVYSDEDFKQELDEAFEKVYGVAEKKPVISKEEPINEVYSDEDMEKRIKEIEEALS